MYLLDETGTYDWWKTIACRIAIQITIHEATQQNLDKNAKNRSVGFLAADNKERSKLHVMPLFVAGRQLRNFRMKQTHFLLAEIGRLTSLDHTNAISTSSPVLE
ncbi:hypothetical protein [Paraburkholderia tropica]|uniref:hypothetical protein n=1 Tax=Paraburkholderia tropica TaxID=92647 RepID=UPI002AB71BB8|nr:hypothetical protein [Paraburkholderia tropica]